MTRLTQTFARLTNAELLDRMERLSMQNRVQTRPNAYAGLRATLMGRQMNDAEKTRLAALDAKNGNSVT